MEYYYEEENQTFHKKTEYELLKHIASRPGMYVGANRLDYIQCFLNGFYMYRRIIMKENDHWNENYYMQKWLFYNESVSIAHAASINGWSLMTRCYGNGETACERFKAFIEEALCMDDKIGIEDTVAECIYQIYSHYHWNKDYYPLSQEIKNRIGGVPYSYESIVPIVNHMMMEPYQELWVYIHYELYFMQVRFLYYTKSKGWVDSTSLINQENYYRDLIILHAYAALVQKEEHSNHIVTIHCKNNQVFIDTIEIVDYWNEVLNHNADKDLCNINPMCHSFATWRESIV